MNNLVKSGKYCLFGRDGSCRDENNEEIRDWWDRNYVFTFLNGCMTDKFLFFERVNTLDNSSAKVKLATSKIVELDESDNSITLK